MCGNSVIRVGVWEPMRDEADTRPIWFGVGFMSADGTVCCSISGESYPTREEAQDAADSQPLEQWLVDEDRSYMDDDYLDYGPVDSDPYDRDGPIW